MCLSSHIVAAESNHTFVDGFVVIIIIALINTANIQYVIGVPGELIGLLLKRLDLSQNSDLASIVIGIDVCFSGGVR